MIQYDIKNEKEASVGEIFLDKNINKLSFKNNYGIVEPVSPTLHSGTFFDTTTQNNGGATVANQVLINSTQNSTGFTLGGSNNIIINNTNTLYCIIFFLLKINGIFSLSKLYLFINTKL